MPCQYRSLNLLGLEEEERDKSRPVLGKVQVDAYDSADDVYYDACIELGIECTKETARDSYNAYKSALKSNVQMAADGAQKKTILSTMLDDVNIGY